MTSLSLTLLESTKDATSDSFSMKDSWNKGISAILWTLLKSVLFSSVIRRYT